MPRGLGGELVIAAADYARDRRAWLRARRSGLGASETATILGLNDWRTPLAVWQDKVSTDDVEDVTLSEAAEWGSALEAVVARKVATRHPELGKLAPTPGLLRHPEHPWMLATLDRVLVERKKADPQALAILEVKTVGDWMFRKRWLDSVPPHVLVQVQQQLAVTGMERAYVVVLVGGQRMPAPYLVERDERVIEQIIEYAGAWWAEHVEGGVVPDPTFADRSSLAAVWPGDDTLPAVHADESLLADLGTFMHAREQEAHWKRQKEEAAFAVQERMGNALAVRDDDGRVLVTWKPSTSTRVNTPALRKAHPDLVEQFTTTTTTRRFLPKESDA